MPYRQLEFLDILTIVSFALQMEFIAQHNEQITNDQLMQKLVQVEQKLDKLLEAVA